MSITEFIKDWIWQLPQNLCGIIWKHIRKEDIITSISNEEIRSVNASAYIYMYRGDVTLGKYIFIGQNFEDKTETIKHECGHVKQSKILGPLYLIVIGIPSILHAWLNRYIHCCEKHGTYYHIYTEKWANKLMEK